MPSLEVVGELELDYRLGFIAAAAQADLVRGRGQLSDLVYYGAAIYGAWVALDESLEALTKGAAGVVEIHILGVARAAMDGFRLTGEDERDLLTWLASWRSVAVTPELLAVIARRQRLLAAVQAGSSKGQPS
jgi:hypothetical protein